MLNIRIQRLLLSLVLPKWMVSDYSELGKSRVSTILFQLYAVCLEDKEYFISIVIRLMT